MLAFTYNELLMGIAKPNKNRILNVSDTQPLSMRIGVHRIQIWIRIRPDSKILDLVHPYTRGMGMMGC